MRVLVWLREASWRTAVDEAARLPADARVTLLHVASAEPEAVARGARQGLLGRRPPPPPPHALEDVPAEAAEALLDEAAGRLGRPAERVALRGRIEQEVVRAAEGADLLVVVRDGEPGHRGPRSLAPPGRFVVDHAPCRVLLVPPGSGSG